MHNCPKCERQLYIGKTFRTFKNDDTPDAPTEAYTNLPMHCVNPGCDNYAGNDLSNPKATVKTIQHKL